MFLFIGDSKGRNYFTTNKFYTKVSNSEFFQTTVVNAKQMYYIILTTWFIIFSALVHPPSTFRLFMWCTMVVHKIYQFYHYSTVKLLLCNWCNQWWLSQKCSYSYTVCHKANNTNKKLLALIIHLLLITNWCTQLHVCNITCM